MLNVIMIIIDTLRRDHIGAYGNRWIKTPALDRLAQESAVFTRAANESLPTLPHRRSILTGLRTFPYRRSYYANAQLLDTRKLVLGKGAAAQPQLRQGGWFMGVVGLPVAGWEPIPLDQITLAELLQLYGYDTCFVTDTGPYMTWPMNFHRGFRHWEFIRGHEADPFGSPSLGMRLLDQDRFVPPGMRGGWEHAQLARIASVWSRWKDDEDYWAAQVFLRAGTWAEENGHSTKPFFMLIDCFDPHEPFLVPKRYADLYDAPGYNGREPVAPRYGPVDYLTERELRRMRALYAADVTFVDHWLGGFLDKLRALGLLDTTLVCLTSDHGFLLGEHGVTGKMPRNTYREVHDVPFMLRHPQGAGAGQRFDAFVQGQDMVPTILSYLGVPAPYPLDGKDLWPVVEGKQDKVRDYLTCGHTLMVRAVDGEHSFLSMRNGEEPRLFDLRNDPAEQENLAPSRPAIVKRMWEYVMEDAQRQPILPGWEDSVVFHTALSARDYL